MTSDLKRYMYEINGKAMNALHQNKGKMGRIVYRRFEQNGLYSDIQGLGAIGEINDFDNIQLGSKFYSFANNKGFIIKINVDNKDLYDVSLVEAYLKQPKNNIRDIIGIPHNGSKVAEAITRHNMDK